MQQFTLSFVLASLGSDRARRAVGSAAFFGAVSALRGHCARLESYSRTVRNIEEKYPERAEKMRHAPTFSDLNSKAEAAANRAAGIHALCEANGIVLQLDFEPPMPKPTEQATLEQLAAITKLNVDFIKKQRQASEDKRYASELEASDLASSLFWTAVADADAPVKFESVQKAIERTRLNILTWSTPDFAELAMLASDEDAVNDWMERMCDDPKQFEREILDEEEQAIAEMRTEQRLLDQHAKQQATLRYLDAERKKAEKTAQRRRVKKDAA